MNGARNAYASARLHARQSRRPGAPQWGALDASRTPQHYVAALRAGGWLHVPEGALDRDVDARERWLRDAWRESCDEVAGWYPHPWRDAFRWAAVLPDLDALERLRADEAVPPWVKGDARLGALAERPPEQRPRMLGAGPYAPLASAWLEGTALVDAWRHCWHALQAPASARTRAVLTELEAAVRHAASLDEALRRETLERASLRVFRRGWGTAAEGFAYLVLVALQLERVRGGLAARAIPPVDATPGGAAS